MPPVAGPPDLRSLRLLAGDTSSALVDAGGSVVWWCAPRPDSSPVFWHLLGPGGGAAGWCDVLDAEPVDANATADACVATRLTLAAGRCTVRDTLLDGTLVRSLEALDGPLTLAAELELREFDPDGASRPEVRVEGADRTKVDGALIRAEVDLDPGATRHLVLAVDDVADDLDAALRRRWDEWEAVGRRVKLPRDHPQRAMDALRVLAACTYGPTGSVIAAPTTSLPEAPGADRQWDYRYSWLRDASAAASVASQLGHPRAAARYLAFLCGRTDLGRGLTDPIVTVLGGDLPLERELDHELWWGGHPVRVGNAAAEQDQIDAVGFFAEALWTHRTCGGRVTKGQYGILERLADDALDPPGPTNGIWELRERHDLVSAEIGRWLLLDRAIRLGRLRRPWRRPKASWAAARTDAEQRTRSALERHRYAPLAFDGPLANEPDAAGLLAVIVGLVAPTDPAAHRLIDATVEALGEGPFLRRYAATFDDGFEGREGAFVPASWWVVSALAVTGRIVEAQQRADAMCEALPLLMPEEWQVDGGVSRGNLPLLWSHMEAARAVSLLHTARIRQRTGRMGVAAWRLWRYALLRVTPD